MQQSSTRKEMAGGSSNDIVVDTVIIEDNGTKTVDFYERMKIIDKNKFAVLKKIWILMVYMPLINKS